MTVELFRHKGRLSLGLPAEPEAGVLCVDFADPSIQHRISKALSGEAVVKAMGQRPQTHSPHPFFNSNQIFDTETHLIDATAGLGLDAFILACAGWHVTLIEQSPLVHALLIDGIQRALDSPNQETSAEKLTRAALSRMYLCPPGSSLDVLPTLPEAHVIYLDPMFPDRDKSARVKKNRYLLQQLHGEEALGLNLLPLALSLARKVVVKRPARALPLENLPPSAAIKGKTSRFDIYAGKSKRLIMP
ncbi:16S rRNA methyltransferase [Gammaproteobacteria bacterium LSUCC0112]|nr:16S rRNA methyltransferase [Gammaproteobacteria bacterium LSUCC0112]